jgi:hypothetical protein
MADSGDQFQISLYLPDDPLATGDAIVVRVSSSKGQRTKVFAWDGAKTRAQLMTEAVAAARAYILSLG